MGLGEVLWDVLPDRTCLGGAPANFAYITTLMGDQGIVASRVGEDSAESKRCGGWRNWSQHRSCADRPAASDRHGESGSRRARDWRNMRLRIRWPGIFWMDPDWQQLAKQADAVCFGSLAQRSPKSRATIRRFVEATSRIQSKSSSESAAGLLLARSARDSMSLADIVKLNDDELPKIMSYEQILPQG